jgi:hypothetical protein
MRLKSAYREKSREISAEEIPKPEIKTDGAESDVTAVRIEAPESEDDPIVAVIGAVTEADASKYALLRQIESLRQSEELQRQHHAAMMAAQRPMTRDDRLEVWKAQGLSEKGAAFLSENPQMIDFAHVSAYAANEIMQSGIERDTPEYFEATRKNFEQAAAQAAQATAQAMPKIFRSTPAPEPAGPPSYVSAPVSRGEVGSYREPLPSQVKLSPEELQIATASGISPAEYARNKIRLAREKRTGQRQ